MNDPFSPFTSGTEKKKFLPDSAHLLTWTDPGQDRAMAADAQETGRSPNRLCLLFLGGQFVAVCCPSGIVRFEEDGLEEGLEQPLPHLWSH